MKWFKNNIPEVIRKQLVFCSVLAAFLVTGCSGPSAVTENSYLQADTTTLLAEQTPDDYSYSVFLIGDGGGSSLEPRSEVLVHIENMLNETGENGAVVFVGDNLYPDGLPPEESKDRGELEDKLVAQLETVKDFPGKIIFMPGNHDWASSGEEGLAYVNRQENFIEEYLNRGNTFLPDNGTPGPSQVTLTQFKDENGGIFELNLIVLDTHWWLHPHQKPYPGEPSSEEEAKQQASLELGNLMKMNAGNEVIIGSHHPMETYGRHGGKFPVKTHIFPPVGGSLYAFYRKIWGYPQDVPHKTYGRMKDDILASGADHQGLILAAGHEHSLQFIPFEENSNAFYQIVSGSATKLSFVKDMDGPVHTFRKYGFGVLRYFPDRSKRLEFYTGEGEKIFETILHPQQYKEVE